MKENEDETKNKSKKKKNDQGMEEKTRMVIRMMVAVIEGKKIKLE